MLAWLITGSGVQAIVLDWNSVSWSDGALTGSIETDASNPGKDVTITITPNGGSYFILNSPTVDNTLTGGQGTSANSLLLAVDWNTDAKSVTVKITFNYTQGVSGVSYTLFDVDALDAGNNSGYQDEVSSIVAQNGSGPLIAPTITTSSDNSKSGSGTNVVVRGTDTATDTANSGNVTVSYGTNTITSMTFTYGNGPDSPNNPGTQGIGLYDITYTPKPKVPEFHVGIAAGLACLAIIGLDRFRKRRQLLKPGGSA